MLHGGHTYNAPEVDRAPTDVRPVTATEIRSKDAGAITPL